MMFRQEGEENDGGRAQGNDQTGGDQPITIDTEIEVDWGKKGQPQKGSADTSNQTEKK